MTWLAWRQFRAQSWAALAALAVIAIAFAATGPHLAQLYNASGIAICRVHGDCGPLSSAFLRQLHANVTDDVLYHLGRGVLFAVPAIIGIFWGAPLITRELETGTLVLAWNQSVTRTRWLATKLGLVGVASMVCAGLLSLMLTWWSGPIERVSMSRITPGTFGASGIAPVGYAAFAFALGITAGVLTRRTVPAMAITVAVFAAAQVAMPLWVRPRLIAPVRVTSPLSLAALAADNVSTATGRITVITPPVNIPGAWIISDPPAITTAAHVASRACLTGSPRASQQACVASLARLHLRQAVSYQPASRYWAFQWYETAIFLALALALAGFCVWWIRSRRLS